MNARFTVPLAVLCTVACLSCRHVTSNGPSAPDRRAAIPQFDGTRHRLPKSRGEAERLHPRLQLLLAQLEGTRGAAGEPLSFSEREIETQFSLPLSARRTGIPLFVTFDGPANVDALKAAGATVLYSHGNTARIVAPVASATAVAAVPGVRLVEPVCAMSAPSPVAVGVAEITSVRGAADWKDATAFDRMGLTGRGVIVGIVDSGIDWRHEDFIRPDGTSRLLWLYDPSDNSWDESHGAIGTEPQAARPGTVYTRDQINAALRGEGSVKHRDDHGHGTACAGVAAGNGRATGNGMPEGSIMGVAPEADLIVVSALRGRQKLSMDVAVRWILDRARELHRPCVINMSLGTHYSTHDGTSPAEVAINLMLQDAGPGVAVCVSGGNEGDSDGHVHGRFGARRPGQMDVDSPPVYAFAGDDTWMLACFSAKDEWGLLLRGSSTQLTSSNGPVMLQFFRSGNTVDWNAFVNKERYDGPLLLRLGSDDDLTSVSQDTFFEKCVSYDIQRATLEIKLYPGTYLVRAFGASKDVVDGTFDLYAISSGTLSFKGNPDRRSTVAAPGTASEVITVGAYNHRSEWVSDDGRLTAYNIALNDLSSYSSRGFRRDGAVKPEIVAPGTYMISSLAADSDMAKTPRAIIKDGRHLAWAGTSAAAPFVTGLVALMLEKNPGLTHNQIRAILSRTARQDDMTGAVPNPDWGYGKVDPAAALRATPPARNDS